MKAGPRDKIRAKLPFILVNMAMSADGKIATANRQAQTFGSERDQKHLLELRATADAVMAGARTVDSAVAILGPGPAAYRRRRVRAGLAEYNLRVVVTGSGTVNPRAHIFRHRFSPIIILTTRRASAGRLKTLRSVADEVRICGRTEIDFPAAFRLLRERWGVKRLLCEGGGELNDALFKPGLVNELHLTICPVICAGRMAPTICDGNGVMKLAQAAHLRLESLRRAGDELFLKFSVIRKPS